MRSAWGLRSLFYVDLDVPLEFISDCLKGIERDEHKQFAPPTIHDFKRNARIRGYLGIRYEHAVDELIEGVRNSGSDKAKLHALVSTFLMKVERLSIDRYDCEKAIPLLRNDPAAANINLLALTNLSTSFFVYRDMRDMMIDWVTYYNHSLDKVGCGKFINQYKKKVANLFGRV